MKKVNMITALLLLIACSALADTDLKLIERAIQNLRSMQSIESLPEVDQKYFFEALENLDTARTAISSGKKYFEYPLGSVPCGAARAFIIRLAANFESSVHTFDCTDSLLKGIFDRSPRLLDPIDFSYPAKNIGLVDSDVAYGLSTLAISFGSILTDGRSSLQANIVRHYTGDKWLYRVDVR